MDEYYIEAGVHRAVAARELGLAELPAVLHREGHPDEEIVVPLDRLHSYRRYVLGVAGRRHNLPELIRAMADPAERSRVPAIEVQPLGMRAQPPSIPLADVDILAEDVP